MNNLDLIIFLWIIGWMYACGKHYSNKQYIRKNSNEEEYEQDIDKGGYLQYALLFLFWPHYIGDSST